MSSLFRWYLKDKIHKLNGPAIVKPNGENFYFLLNKLLSKEEHINAIELHAELNDLSLVLSMLGKMNNND